MTRIDFSKPLQTRGGRTVRILTRTLNNPVYPVVAAVVKEDGTEVIESYTPDGRNTAGMPSSAWDLVNVPEETFEYLNYYGRNRYQPPTASKALADRRAVTGTVPLQAQIKITKVGGKVTKAELCEVASAEDF